jgi:hypothetical protein
VVAVVGTTWRRTPRVLSRTTPLGILVCVPHFDAPLKLEGAAALVFEALATNASGADVVMAIANRVGRTAEDIGIDVFSSIEQLAACGAIEVAPGA